MLEMIKRGKHIFNKAAAVALGVAALTMSVAPVTPVMAVTKEEAAKLQTSVSGLKSNAEYSFMIDDVKPGADGRYVADVVQLHGGGYQTVSQQQYDSFRVGGTYIFHFAGLIYEPVICAAKAQDGGYLFCDESEYERAKISECLNQPEEFNRRIQKLNKDSQGTEMQGSIHAYYVNDMYKSAEDVIVAMDNRLNVWNTYANEITSGYSPLQEFHDKGTAYILPEAIYHRSRGESGDIAFKKFYDEKTEKISKYSCRWRGTLGITVQTDENGNIVSLKDNQ